MMGGRRSLGLGPPLGLFAFSSSEDKHHHQSGGESSKMREIRDATTGLARESSDTAKHLSDEPEPEKRERGNLHDVEKQKKEDEHEHARVGEEDQVRTHDSGDRAARTDKGSP